MPDQRAPRSIHSTNVRFSDSVRAVEPAGGIGLTAIIGLVSLVPGLRRVAAEQMPDQRTRSCPAGMHVPVAVFVTQQRHVAPTVVLLGAFPVTKRHRARVQIDLSRRAGMTVCSRALTATIGITSRRKSTVRLRSGGRSERSRRARERRDKAVGRGQLIVLVTSDAAAVLLVLRPDPVTGPQRHPVGIDELELNRSFAGTWILNDPSDSTPISPRKRFWIDREKAHIRPQPRVEPSGRAGSRRSRDPLRRNAFEDSQLEVGGFGGPVVSRQVRNPDVKAVNLPGRLAFCDYRRTAVRKRRAATALAWMSWYLGSSKTSSIRPDSGSKR